MITDKLNTIAENEQKVYDAGAKSEYERFWSEYLKYTDGEFLFAGAGWKKSTLNPPKGTVIKPTNGYMMFGYSFITDLVEFCNEHDITIDFSNASTASFLIYSSQISRLGILDFRKVNIFTNTFASNKLVTVDKLILRDSGTQTFNNSFNNSTKLQNIVIEGKIGRNGFNVQSCPLTYDSLVSIKNALIDKSSDTSGTTWVITVGDTNKGKYTEQDLNEISTKGWVVK